MGAWKPPTVTSTPASVRGSGPTMLFARIVPWTLGTRLMAEMVASPQGVRPCAKLAAFPKLVTLMGGPGSRAVRLMVMDEFPTVAVMVIGPGLGPAVTFVLATPPALVTAEAGLTDPPPLVIVNATATPGTGAPLVSRTSTATGCPNGCP